MFAIDLLTIDEAATLRAAISSRRSELIDAWIKAYRLNGISDYEYGCPFWGARIEALNSAAIALGFTY